MSDPMTSKAAPPHGYAWIATGGSVVCYPSDRDNQFIAPIAESSKRTDFHDEALAQATREINGVIARVTQSNDDPSKVPSWIVVPGGRLMLVWAEAEHPLSAASDPAAIMEALGTTMPGASEY